MHFNAGLSSLLNVLLSPIVGRLRPEQAGTWRRMRRIAWTYGWPRLRLWVGSRGDSSLSRKAGLRACADQHPASQQQTCEHPLGARPRAPARRAAPPGRARCTDCRASRRTVSRSCSAARRRSFAVVPVYFMILGWTSTKRTTRSLLAMICDGGVRRGGARAPFCAQSAEIHDHGQPRGWPPASPWKR